MSKQPLKYLKNEIIEDVTACRIREYEAKAGVTVGLPVPIEQIVEQILGLDFDWDEIEEQPGMDKEDLVQEGLLALYQVIDRCDPARTTWPAPVGFFEISQPDQMHLSCGGHSPRMIRLPPPSRPGGLTDGLCYLDQTAVGCSCRS